jgi:hypothetical protein
MAAAFFAFLFQNLLNQWQVSRDRRASIEAIAVAFHGEVHSIRGSLNSLFRTVMHAYGQGLALKRYGLGVPTKVYDSHVGRLGELRDRDLVRQLVNFYELLGRADREGQRIEQGVYDAVAAFPEYGSKLSSCIEMALLLEASLRDFTAHVRQPERVVNLTDDDVALRKFILESRQALQDSARISAYREAASAVARKGGA